MKNKSIIYFGIFSYVILFILALLFYRERVIFLDMAFHLFYILKDNDLAIQNFRFGACFTQLFPYLGQKLGFSLDNIAKLYSSGFVLYYASIFA